MTFLGNIKTNKLGQKSTVQVEASSHEEAITLILAKIQGFATLVGRPYAYEQQFVGYTYNQNRDKGARRIFVPRLMYKQAF